MIFNINQPLIIGEVSGNHQGSAEGLYSLVKNAVQAGIKCIKFQYYDTDEVLTQRNYTLNHTIWKNSNLYDLYKCNEIKFEWFEEPINFLKSNSIPFGFTISGLKTLKAVLETDCQFLKVASFDALDNSLIDYCLSSRLPLVVSDGVMDAQRRKEFLQYVTQQNTFDVPLTLLHCSSEYPSTISDYSPKRFLSQLAEFPTVTPGISDHTLDNSLIAYTSGLGFSFFEKHIKLSTDNTSIDSSFSADVTCLGKLQEWLDKTSENNTICESSRVTNVFQRACYWRHSCNQNDIVTRDMVIYRRILFPQGITPDCLPDVLGKKLLNGVRAGDPLLASDFC